MYMCSTISHTRMEILLFFISSKLRSSTLRSQSHNGKCLFATVLFHSHLYHFHPIQSEQRVGLCFFKMLIDNIT